MKSTLYPLAVPLLVAACALAAEPVSAQKPGTVIEPFSLSSVQLLDGPFKTARDSMFEKILTVNPDRLLAYPRREAGLPTKGEPLPMPIFNYGAGVGHHLSACSMMWQVTGDQRLLERIAYLVAGLEECQRANGDGYCGGVPQSKQGWGKLKEGKLELKPAGGFNDMGGVPWYNMHKIFAGLVDAYRRCGFQPALPVLTNLTEWCAEVVAKLDAKTMQEMLSVEHGGMAESLADVYTLTGNARYLALARRFRDDYVFVPMLEDRNVLHVLPNPNGKAPGLHANTQIPKFTGYERLYELTGEKDYHDAALNFWRRVVNRHSYAMGGNSAHELFFAPDQWEESIRHPAGPESCNTYNMLKLSARLFRADPKPEFVEFYERAMFNHVLATVNPRTGGRAYHTALCPVAYRASDPEATSCCGFTVEEMQFLAHEMIYAHSADTLWVNLFVASEVKWAERNVVLRQETRFPYEPRSTIQIQTPQRQRFDMLVRRPLWAGTGFAVAVNGKPAVLAGKGSEYVRLSRDWADGDRITVELPMTLTAAPLQDGSRWFSIQYGPILLAASHGALGFPESSRTGQVGKGRYGAPEEWPVIVGSAETLCAHLKAVPGEPLHFQSKALIQPTDLPFKPFFEMADERYSVYLPVMTEDGWRNEQVRRDKMATAEKALDARTVDKVAVLDVAKWQKRQLNQQWWGKLKFGVADGLSFWRIKPNPGSEISCELTAESGQTNELYCRFWADKGPWRCKITVNGRLLAEENHKGGTKAPGRTEVTYPIPEEWVASTNRLNVRIESCPWTPGPGVSEIRVLAPIHRAATQRVPGSLNESPGKESSLGRHTASLLPGIADKTLFLAGQWRFALDAADAGVQEKWYGKPLADRVQLPGILQSQGYGNAISTNTPWISNLKDPHWQDRESFKPFTQSGNVKIPYFSQPPRHYLGAAWYQRDIEIPSSWSGKQVMLILEHPHWRSDVWLDDQAVGFNRALQTPHLYDLGTAPPGRHVLTIRVDNRKAFPLGDDSHSISDQLGGTWNGIVGRIELQAVSTVRLDTVNVYPNAAEKTVRMNAIFRNASGTEGRGALTVQAKLRGATTPAASKTVEVGWTKEGGVTEIVLPLGPDARLWDEFNPNLYELRLELSNSTGSLDRRTLTFGLRDFKANGSRFAINGRTFCFRGTHFGGDFALTGYPAMDIASWRRIFAVCKSYGINAMRFHSWCPPEAAFAAADELGFYLQPECGNWSGFDPGGLTEQFIYAEAAGILASYGNHPSFVMLSQGNEPWGQERTKVLFPWVEHFQKQDPRRLYSAKTGHEALPGDPSDYMTLMFGAQQTYMRSPGGWFGKDYRSGLVGITVPVLTHEVGQWFAVPDFDAIISSMTGYLRPANLELFRDIWQRTGMLPYNKAFAESSGRFQTLCYKEEIEASRRTPGLAGFELLDLRDYLGQGTALVGAVDPLWNPKSYVTPREYRRFCGVSAPLARMPQRVYRSSEKLKIDVEIAYDGPTPMTSAEPGWKVLNAADTVIASGKFPVTRIPTGTNTILGTIEADLATWPAPAQYRLLVGLDHTDIENDWNFWLYPEQVVTNAPADVLITHDFDEAEVRLSAGGKVLYLPRMTDLEWASPMTRDLPVFWNELLACQWNRFQGVWCDPKHPALASFPTDNHFDWQWRELVEFGRCRAMRLTDMPRDLKPIVYVIDQLVRGQKLAMVFECRIGSGRLLVCSADVDNQLEQRVVARQLRRSLLNYVSSKAFQPAVSLSSADIRTLLLDNLIMKKLGAQMKGDGQMPDAPANAAIDGDPSTYWQAGPGGTGKHPHWLEVEFPQLVDIEGLVYLPRQNHYLMEGGIRGYRVEISADGTHWTTAAEGEWPSSFNPQTVRFQKKEAVRKLRLIASSGVGEDTTASVAELTVFYAGPKLPPMQGGAIQYKKVRTSTQQVVEPE